MRTPILTAALALVSLSACGQVEETVDAAPVAPPTPRGTVSRVPTLTQWTLALLAGLAALLGGRQLGQRMRQPKAASPHIDTLV